MADSSVAKATIGLVMIVRNEAHGIRRTLESLRSIIDRWTVYDTGSVDGTQAIVRDVLRDLPGELHEGPFVDFSTARNRALDLHGASTTFTLMPDADDYLVGDAAAMRSHLDEHATSDGVQHEAYLVNIRRVGMSYYLPLVLRASAGWRYRGVVHEFVSKPGSPPASIRVPDVALCQDVVPQSAAASRARWERDLDLLRAARQADPSDTRTVFYLAQTLECLGHLADADAMYRERVLMGGWQHEAYEAAYRRARVSVSRRESWELTQQRYLDAHAVWSARAEPLVAIAEYYMKCGNWPLCYLFSRRARELPRPITNLFVEEDVYAWRSHDLVSVSAYYVGKDQGSAVILSEGREAALAALAARPNDARIIANLRHYG